MKSLFQIKRLYSHLLYTIGILSFAPAFSQTPNPSSTENYIMSTEYLTKTANADSALYSIMYFDGLGREKQSIAVRAGGDNKDIVTQYEYDGLGRQVRDYLPAPTGQVGGQFIVDPTSAYTGHYGVAPYNTPIYYSAKNIENSPLGRVLEQGAPGNDWQLGSGHEIKFQYYSNNATEVIIYRVNPSNGNLEKGLSSSNINYAAKSLYKTTTTDENGHFIQEFKNKQGKVILKRTYVASATQARGTNPGSEPTHAADTYYVYNAYGELAYVLPPNLSALYVPGNILPSNWGEMMNNLGYAYKYDAKGRLTDKKLPGKEWEYMEYDKQDRLVATQDAVMRANNQWLFTKYDRFGRVLYTGIASGSRSSIKSAINTAGTNNEQRNDTGFTQNGLSIKYTKTAFPTAFTEILSVNYYDYYGNITMNGSTPPTGTYRTGTVLNADKENSLKGLLVASSVRILNTGANDWEHSYTYYDKKSRPIRTYKKNHLGGFTILDTKLDFRSKTTESSTTHRRTATETQVKTTDKFFYDKQERLTRHTQRINDVALAEQLISFNEYDRLGQLITKKVGGNSPTGANRWQEIDYKYNIRGWLTSINDIGPVLMGKDAQPPTMGDDLFAFRIQYNDVVNNSSGIAAPLYNGNISQTFWKTAMDNVLRGYSYTYDQMNRLRQANFYKAGTNPYSGAYDESLAYDRNGNILNLVRYTGDANNIQVGMDELTYSYEVTNGQSNRLMKVTDAVSGTSTGGFSNGSSGTSNDYTYDANGNMLSDLNKGITEIIYNHLNLPEYISFANGNAIEYLYNAAGVKVKKKVYDMTAPPSGFITEVEYLDGFQYAGGILQFFPHAEGYVSATLNANAIGGNQYIFNYVYNYTDHLGNIRLSYTKDPVSNQLKIMEENHYYPFGLKHAVYSGTIKQKYELVDDVPETARPGYAYKTDYNYKYNGKEFQDELGLNMYDMDMRQYDPAIARWVVMDPVVHHSMSPYNAFDNNPVFWADPSGADARSLIKDAWDATPEGENSYWVNKEEASESDSSDTPPDDHFDQNGNFLYTDDKETNNIVIHKPVSSKNPLSPIDLSEMQIELKDYLFTNDSDFMLLVNIAAYYAKFAGVDVSSLHNESFSVGAFYVTDNRGHPQGRFKYYNEGNYGGSKVIMNADTDLKTISIHVRNGHVKSLLNNKYNFISVLGHEGGSQGHLGMPNASHATIYKNQMNQPVFKLTTPAFQESVKYNYTFYGGK